MIFENRENISKNGRNFVTEQCVWFENKHFTVAKV